MKFSITITILSLHGSDTGKGRRNVPAMAYYVAALSTRKNYVFSKLSIDSTFDEPYHLS